MTGLLKIDQDQCRRDGLCVKVCPGAIIRMNKTSGYPEMIPRGENGCIRCGHCVAVCPEGAMHHADIPLAQCPPLKPELAATREQVVQFLRLRRSIRVFRDRPVEKQILQPLIEIARYAPTAGNSQLIKWVAVTEKEKIRHFTERTIAHMRHAVAHADPTTYAPYWRMLVASWDRGHDVVLRSAPALVIAAAPQRHAHGMTDVTLALTYLELAAAGHGLGTCWAGLLHTAMVADPEFADLLPVLKTHTHHYPLMIGYPGVRYYRLPERHPPDIEWL